MKKLFALLFCCLGFSAIQAQYDFPVVINGLSISLDLQSSKVVYPQQWLVAGIGDCRPDSMLISRTIFPRGTTPPPSAADSLLFTCLDFNSESIEIWWKNSQNEWLVTDSYTLISGFDACGCSDDCGLAAQSILINGLSTGFAADATIQVSAREFVAVDFPDQSYSYSSDPADSVRTYACPAQVVAVEIFAHAPGLISRSASTYLAIDGQNCDGIPATGSTARVIQGLSVPLGPEGMVSIPARAFASPYSPGQLLAFSSNQTDTISTITCASLTNGALQVELFDHSTGTPGSPALSYLIADNGRRFCGPTITTFPANDASDAAILLDSCTRFGQFYIATTEAGELLTNNNGGTVWYAFPLFAAGTRQNLSIRALDSCIFTVYSPLAGLKNPIATGLVVPGDTTLELCYTGDLFFENWLVQIQQLDSNLITRYFLSIGPEANCPSTTEEIAAILPEIFVYPNPGRGTYRLAGFEGEARIDLLMLYDQFGRLVRELPPGNQFTLTGLPAGVYYLRLVTEAGRHFLRFVHQ